LRQQYETLRGSLPAMPEKLEPIVLNGVLATFAHAAYHLGAMRQMVKVL